MTIHIDHFYISTAWKHHTQSDLVGRKLALSTSNLLSTTPYMPLVHACTNMSSGTPQRSGVGGDYRSIFGQLWEHTCMWEKSRHKFNLTLWHETGTCTEHIKRASIPLLHAQTSVLRQKEEEGVYGAFERAFLHISSYMYWNNEHKVTLWVGESRPTPLASSQDNVCDVVDLYMCIDHWHSRIISCSFGGFTYSTLRNTKKRHRKRTSNLVVSRRMPRTLHSHTSLGSAHRPKKHTRKWLCGRVLVP
jgi:hypothetical protein